MGGKLDPQFIAFSLLVMGALGVLFGIGLALASRFFHVESDPRIEAVSAALPGVNCGACGFAGCDAYAEAVVKGAPPNLCIPGGHDTALQVAHIMGAKLEDERREVRAVVHCQGGADRCGRRNEYDGIEDCRAADLIQGGPKSCDFGCLGYGTCARACPFGAITMGPDRIPVINWEKCTGCGTCAKVCPRDLIEIVPATITHYLACSSRDRGKAVKSVCSVGCIACWLCVKVSPDGAIERGENLPRLTYPEGVDYSAAMDKCPMHCFVAVRPPLVNAREVETAEATTTG